MKRFYRAVTETCDVSWTEHEDSPEPNRVSGIECEEDTECLFCCAPAAENYNHSETRERNLSGESSLSGIADRTAAELRSTAEAEACRNNMLAARLICEVGVRRFPDDIDLRALLLKYSDELGDYESADENELWLSEVPMCQMTEPAMRISLEYLLHHFDARNEDACRLKIAVYRAFFPYSEEHYLLEHELERNLGNMDDSIEVLQQAVRTVAAPKCALKLAEKYYLPQGFFSDALEMIDYAIKGSFSAKPDFNVPYCCYLKTLVENRMLQEKPPEDITEAEVSRIENEYMLLEQMPELSSFRKVIHMRRVLLKFISKNEAAATGEACQPDSQQPRSSNFKI